MTSPTAAPRHHIVVFVVLTQRQTGHSIIAASRDGRSSHPVPARLDCVGFRSTLVGSMAHPSVYRVGEQAWTGLAVLEMPGVCRPPLTTRSPNFALAQLSIRSTQTPRPRLLSNPTPRILREPAASGHLNCHFCGHKRTWRRCPALTATLVDVLPSSNMRLRESAISSSLLLLHQLHGRIKQRPPFFNRPAGDHHRGRPLLFSANIPPRAPYHRPPRLRAMWTVVGTDKVMSACLPGVIERDLVDRGQHLGTGRSSPFQRPARVGLVPVAGQWPTRLSSRFVDFAADGMRRGAT